MAGRPPSSQPTVAGALRLDLANIMRRRAAVPGSVVRSTVAWGDTMTATLAADLTEGDRGILQIRYTTPDIPNRPGKAMDRSIALTTREQHFGGRRWWFVCPRSGRLARVLVLPYGADGFGSQASYGLKYACQCQGRTDRAIARARKARARMGLTDPDLGNRGPARKPHRMRWSTFHRLTNEAREAEEIVWGNLARWVEGHKAMIGISA